MNDDTARLSAVWQVFRRRWRLLAVIAMVGALIGVGAALVFPPDYKTTTSVVLQGQRDSDELLTEAQVAQSSVVLGRAATALKWGLSGTDLADQVSATVATGNIIDITATADTPERAQQLADRMAQEYVTYSTQLLATTADASAQVTQEQQQTLRQEISETNQKITDLHNSAGQGQTIDSVGVRTELEQLRSALSDATAKLNELNAVNRQAKMVVMGPAERPTSPAPPTMTHFVAGGAVVFFIVGLFAHLFAARSDRRVRGENDIASALGAGILGGIDVPAVPETTPTTGVVARVRRFFLGDQPWQEATLPLALDEAGSEIRYRRVLARLREQLPTGPGRVLVVVANDDPTALQGASRLAEFSAAERLDLRIWQVDATRPTVPDDAVPGVLAVVTTRTRTGWELVGIAEACADAGHDVLGVVVTHRTRYEEQVREPALAGAG